MPSARDTADRKPAGFPRFAELDALIDRLVAVIDDENALLAGGMPASLAATTGVKSNLAGSIEEHLKALGAAGPVTDAERASIIAMSPIAGQYDKDIDRESAFEILNARAEKAAEAAAQKEAAEQRQRDGVQEGSAGGRWSLPGFGNDKTSEEPASKPRTRTSGYQRETVIEAAMKSAARTVATQVGRAIIRGILGSLKR